jgi:LPXTG-motif cell wall-anchored protein
VSGSPGLRIFGCSVNRLLDVVGLPSGLRLDYAGGEYGSGYAGMSDQAVIIPVSVNPASPGSYVSDAAYPLDSGHSIVLANAEASYSNVTKRFRTTVVNTPIGFTDDDGTGQEITGTITFVATTIPGSKDITSFVLAGVRANITGTSITATVPYGTDITALTPIIAHTGAGISLTGAQDFTLPVTYTVIAEDNSTKDYVVTVAVSRSIPLISAPSTWTGAASVVARIDASLADFIRLTLDGVEVNSSNYTLAEGSTVITFAETYLKTLADGEYIFTAEFRNGTADIPLKVSVHPSSEAGFAEGDSRDTLPATGDEGSFALMIVVGLLLGTGAVLLARRHRLRSFLGDRSML